MQKITRLAYLPLISLWLIILTCAGTDIFYLKKPVFLLSAIPVAAITAAAMLNLRRSSGGNDG